MENICLLGASGSVGESTLKVLRLFPGYFRLHSFSVHGNVEKAKSIIEEFHPEFAVISGSHDSILGSKYNDTKIYYGSEALSEIASLDEVGTVVTAIVGAIGIYPTIAAIEKNKKIAIANKETLVSFGPYINNLLKKKSSILVPVDSEHNALFQLLALQKPENIRSITLTASGGSFRDLPIEKLSTVSVEEALNHPTWKMGPKITIDSAGLVNKGLEVIEAHFLFGIPYEKIEVVIHPESIVHGMIETNDGAYFSYSSDPDMIFPVAHSLFYPETVKTLLRERKPASWKNLQFIQPDMKRYPALSMAYNAGKAGGTAPGIFNAANEEAVSLFLNRIIQFTDIPILIESALEKIKIEYPETLLGYEEAANSARSFIRNKYLKEAV
ncbi:MAG: 1-deoxy-D-xylulose-5-phosphate reductoisomerase [Leptospira sp.]|nr:1-deoxy-D-xylulose-5-phosphate reductoisomerase [Leptospira sp.]